MKYMSGLVNLCDIQPFIYEVNRYGFSFLPVRSDIRQGPFVSGFSLL